MPFTNLPLRMTARATVGQPMQFKRAEILARYVLGKDEPELPEKPDLVQVVRDHRRSLSTEFWEVCVLPKSAIDGKARLFKIAFKGGAFTKALAAESREKTPALFELYEAFLDQARVRMELRLKPFPPKDTSDCDKDADFEHLVYVDLELDYQSIAPVRAPAQHRDVR